MKGSIFLFNIKLWMFSTIRKGWNNQPEYIWVIFRWHFWRKRYFTWRNTFMQNGFNNSAEKWWFLGNFKRMILIAFWFLFFNATNDFHCCPRCKQRNASIDRKSYSLAIFLFQQNGFPSIQPNNINHKFNASLQKQKFAHRGREREKEKNKMKKLHDDNGINSTAIIASHKISVLSVHKKFSRCKKYGVKQKATKYNKWARSIEAIQKQAEKSVFLVSSLEQRRGKNLKSL